MTGWPFWTRLRAFLAGRRGFDALGGALLAAAFACRFAAVWFAFGPLLWPALLFLLAFALRALSRNLPARARENDAFLRLWHGMKSFALRLKQGWRNVRGRIATRKTHVFLRCPVCRARMRVPRGKGRIRVTCPGCGHRFEKKT